MVGIVKLTHSNIIRQAGECFPVGPRPATDSGMSLHREKDLIQVPLTTGFEPSAP
jgi:hypothetical protein